jgi:hypothetical protein
MDTFLSQSYTFFQFVSTSENNYLRFSWSLHSLYLLLRFSSSFSGILTGNPILYKFICVFQCTQLEAYKNFCPVFDSESAAKHK